MARGDSGNGLSGRVVGALVAFLIYFAILEALESQGKWNASATYAKIITTLVPIFLALYVVIGSKLNTMIARG